MSRKKLKSFSCLMLLFLMGFLFFPKVQALDKVGQIPLNPQPYTSLSYYSVGLPTNYTRYLAAYAFYATSPDGMTSQTYCIQQNTPLGKGYEIDPKNIMDYDKLSIFQKNMIFQILSYGHNVGRHPYDSFDDIIRNNDPAKVLATQELVWEVSRNERTTMSTYAPKGGGCNDSICPFYSLIKNGANGTTAIWNEYVRIIDAVRYSFGQAPNGFNIQSQAQTYSMDYRNSKFVLTLNDSHGAYKYFNIKTSSGISATVSNGGSTLTITSNNPLTSLATVTITNTNPESNMLVYVNSSKQDMVRGSATINYYLNLRTPEYQIKINKSGKLDGKPLAGATFKICSNSSCTNVLGTVQTGTDGTAKYTNIKYPGTYYVKETVAPPGYELDSTPHAVNVSTSNISGSTSYGNVSVSDTNKEFNLTKKSVDVNGNIIDLDDGCGTEKYIGPEFEIKDKRGYSLYFNELSPGKYDLTSKDAIGAVTKLKTCNGKFKVYTLTECNYKIAETKAPDGLTLPSSPTRPINVCGADKNVSFTNGFTGLEFQKKDEDGNFVNGGKFSLQLKINNVYKDVLLKQVEEGNYTYDTTLKESDQATTYIMITKDGISRVSKLSPGEYRVVEKEAPEGYEVIKDKDSNALVTVKDSDKNGYYLVEIINQKAVKNGSRSFAELIVTIITGRKVPNYILIISGLAVLLILTIIIRKRIKK